MIRKFRLKTRFAITTAILIVVILACTTVVSGYTADKVLPSGNYIQDGTSFSINLNGLVAGNKVNFSVSSTNLRPTATPVIEATSFPMPFAGVTDTSKTNVSGTNINRLTLKVIEQGGTIYEVDNTTLPDPKIFGTRDLKKETYQLIRFSGTPAVAGADVGLLLWMNSTVAAAPAPSDPANLQFTLQGVSSGDFTISVYAGNTYVKSWALTIGSPPAPPPNYDVGGSGGGAAPSGGVAGAAPPSGVVTAPSGQEQVTMLIAQEGQTLETYSVSTPGEATVDATMTVEQGTTITSPTGAFVDTVSIQQVSLVDVPSTPEGASFAFAGAAINCGPEGATFSEPVTLTFSLTQEQWDLALAQANGNPAMMEVQYYDRATQSWVGIPTTVDPVTHVVTAQATHFSLFALVVIQAPPTTPGAAIPTAAATPGLTREPTPLLAKPPVTTVKPTPAPFASVPAMIGVLVVAGLAYTLGRKR